MAASEGNQWWKLRAKHGRDKIFSDPNILWDCCQDYFESVDKRKWYKTEFNGKDAVECQVPCETPYTWTGLYLFLNIAHDTWQLYEQREDFIETCLRVRNIIYTQKFEGASVGAFNANIISRDLGLTDKAAIDHTTMGQALKVMSNLTDEDMIRLAEIQGKANGS